MRRLTILTISAALLLGACSDGGDDPAVSQETETAADDTTTEAGDDGMDDNTDEEAAADGEVAGTVTVVGTDNVAWESTDVTAPAGTVELVIECGATVPHAIAIEGVQADADLATCSGGGSGDTVVDLEAGTYTFFCTVPGHRDAGMEGTLTVG